MKYGIPKLKWDFHDCSVHALILWWFNASTGVSETMRALWSISRKQKGFDGNDYNFEAFILTVTVVDSSLLK